MPKIKHVAKVATRGTVPRKTNTSGKAATAKSRTKSRGIIRKRKVG